MAQHANARGHRSPVPPGHRTPQGKDGSTPRHALRSASAGDERGSLQQAPTQPKPTAASRVKTTWRYHSGETLQRMRSRIEKHRERLKEDLGSLRRRIRSRTPVRSGADTDQRRALQLLSVQPRLVHDGFSTRRAHIEYTARLRLDREDHQHTWETDPFTLNQLIAMVVSTRVALATRWCVYRSSSWWAPDGKGGHRPVGELLLCALRNVSCWAVMLMIAQWLHSWLYPLAQGMRQIWSDSPKQEERLDADWLAAASATVLLMSSAFGLLAGVTEMSFLPAKVILHLERKDETEQVREQLHMLLRDSDCLENLDICNFLSLGMATYYNSSETQKEGRCFYRRYESADVYWARARRSRWSFGCVTCDCRRRGPLGTERGLAEQWLVLRKDGIALFKSMAHPAATDMLFFDTSFSLFRNDEDRILVCGATFVLELAFPGHAATSFTHPQRDCVQSWCNAITLTAQLSTRTKEQRFGSFAPIRHPAMPKSGDRHMLRGSLARFLVSGRATFRKMAEAICLARHEIFIMGFWVSPHIPLVREGETLPGIMTDPRLSSLLLAAAERGVRVCVLLYHEMAMMMPNDSETAEAELNKLRHSNIFVVRHRSQWDSNRLWTHHEKVMAVDQQLAFVGGLDLCLGRYDDARKRLCDDAVPSVWEAQDYSNPRTRDFVVPVHGPSDGIDRGSQPRMPWQDIACVLLGRAARDVARHCIERWNHAKNKRPQYQGFPTALLRRKVAVCNDAMLKLAEEGHDACWPPAFSGWQECTAQVVRSVGCWSAGTRTETSVHAAFCDLIQGSERFVYIENQFFVSGMDGNETVGNRVVEALIRRVQRAHQKERPFHVMIVLPLLPAFEGVLAQNASSPVQFVMHWQYKTLRALRQSLKDADIPMERYFSICGLRTHDVLKSGPVTEQVYVHSKLMLVDDRVSLVGSANVNDRSLLGIRDSEVNVVLQDNDAFGDGFAAGLRKALFAEHLGWTRQRAEAADQEPLSLVLEEARQVARRNTQIYEDVFGALPSDCVRSWKELASRRAASGLSSGDATRVPTPELARRLSEVRGHIVEFPLDFLVDEDLAPPTFSVGALTPDCFT